MEYGPNTGGPIRKRSRQGKREKGGNQKEHSQHLATNRVGVVTKRG